MSSNVNRQRDKALARELLNAKLLTMDQVRECVAQGQDRPFEEIILEKNLVSTGDLNEIKSKMGPADATTETGDNGSASPEVKTQESRPEREGGDSPSPKEELAGAAGTIPSISSPSVEEQKDVPQTIPSTSSSTGSPVVPSPSPPGLAPSPSSTSSPAATTGAKKCENHGDVEADFKCCQCGTYFCPQCVDEKAFSSGIPTHLCRLCGGLCNSLAAYKKENLPATPKDFSKLLMGAFTYPTREFGLVMCGVGAVVFSFLRLLTIVPMVGLLIMFLLVGFYVNYMIRVINKSAMGETAPPDWPPFHGIWHLVNFTFTFIAILITSFGPSILAAYYLGLVHPLALVLYLLGIFLFPMNFMAVAMFKSVEVLNPIFIIDSISKVWNEYLIACGVMILIFIIRYPAYYIADMIPVLGWFGQEFIFLYFLMVNCHILGLIYWANEEKLGWFEQRPNEASLFE